MKWLCKIGIHRWERQRGGGLATIHRGIIGIAYDKKCKRCGKEGVGIMVL